MLNIAPNSEVPRRAGPRRDVQRRAGPRVALTSRVDVLCEGLALPVRGASLDVGLGGLCVELSEQVDPGSVRSVRLLHGRLDLSLDARGSWLGEGPTAALLGVQFVALNDGQRAALWQLLNQRALQLTRFLVEQSELAPIDVDVAMDLTLGTRRRHFEPGQFIYRSGTGDEGEPSVFIVAHGRVSLEAELADGGRIAIDEVETGQVFGGAPSLLGVPHVDSARAVTDVQLLEVEHYTMRSLISEKPFVARALERAAFRRYLLHVQALTKALPADRSLVS